MTESLFETIDEDEYTKALAEPEKAVTKSKYNTNIRTLTAWFKLPTSAGKCTVPTHEEIQASLPAEAKQYRVGVSFRMVYQIEDHMVCRDCYVAKADLK